MRMRVSENFFDMLGVRPAWDGRIPSADEGRARTGGGPAARVWRRGRRGSLDLSRKIANNGVGFTIVGVTPADFRMPFGSGRGLRRLLHPERPEAPGGRAIGGDHARWRSGRLSRE